MNDYLAIGLIVAWFINGWLWRGTYQAYIEHKEMKELLK